MSAVQYCSFGDLPVEMCACHKCHPDVREAFLDAGPITPGRGALLDQPTFEPVGRLFEASFPGTCEGCGGNIRAGNMIARSTEGYICSGCAA